MFFSDTGPARPKTCRRNIKITFVLPTTLCTVLTFTDDKNMMSVCNYCKHSQS